MNIYVSHKRRSDFEKEFYSPLKNSDLAKQHTFIFPHENNANSFNAKDLFENKKCDVVLAEVSEAATGQGIELAWAEQYGIPIVCVYKRGSDISGSLRFLTNNFIVYESSNDMIDKIQSFMKFNTQ